MQERIIMSNAVLKNIAYLTMLIDHFFAIVFIAIIQQSQIAGYETDILYEVYSIGRAVGRIAFVLFAFLTVEGFVHTRSRRNYLLRLGLFALVSEVPFDLAFSQKVVDPESQNVFFTLFFGVLAMTIWEQAVKGICRLQERERMDFLWYFYAAVLRVVQYGGALLCCMAAYGLNTDYKYMGVLLIFTFYLTRGFALLPKMALAGCVMLFGTWSMNCLQYSEEYSVDYLFQFSLRELYGLLAFLPIAHYDGSKGRQMPKAVCYGFYPVHLMALYGTAQVLVRFF